MKYTLFQASSIKHVCPAEADKLISSQTKGQKFPNICTKMNSLLKPVFDLDKKMSSKE
jgi:hypothetical protein